MSTKIFDAYILPAGAYRSARSLMALSRRIRDAMAPVSRRLAYRAMASRVAYFADCYTAGVVHGTEKSPLSKLVDEWDHARAEMVAGRRSVSWDFNLQWTLYVTAEERVVIKLFGEEPMCAAFRKAFPSAKDFHFQTATDRPSHVSGAEWLHRRRTWSRLMAGGPHCSCGLTMRLWGDYHGPSIFETDQILRRIPSLRKRAEAVADEIVVRDWGLIHKTDDKDSFDATELFAFIRNYRSSENRGLRDVLVRDIQRKLTRNLTLDLLRTTGAALNPSDIRALLPTAADKSLTSALL